MGIRILILLSLILFLLACKKDGVKDPVPLASGSGILVVNEGNFTWGNSSLSYINTTDGSIRNNIFSEINSAPLGDVAVSLCVQGTSVFIVVNNSGKIYRINSETFGVTGQISGLTSPRFMLPVNANKAYLTHLYDNRISILDLTACTVTGHIFIGRSTEAAVIKGQFAYISSWSFSDRVYKIDVLSDVVTDSVQTGKQPNSMVLDYHGDLWLLCDGGFTGSSAGEEHPRLQRYDSDQLNLERSIVFSDISMSPTCLQTNQNGDSLWFLNGGIYAMSVSDTLLPASPLVSSSGRNLYSLHADPVSGHLFVTDAVNYVSSGKVFEYTKTGVLVKSWTAGIIPAGMTRIGD
jgi:hypothetical protein